MTLQTKGYTKELTKLNKQGYRCRTRYEFCLYTLKLPWGASDRIHYQLNLK